MQRAVQAGFTLIELMIALVIVAIISSIAATVFTGADEDAERARIVTEMVALNDAMARYYQGSYTYENATMAILRTGGGTPIAASPAYTVELDVDADGQGYVLAARPVAGGAMDEKGAYTVDETGQRCSFPGDDGAEHPGDGLECDTHW